MLRLMSAERARIHVRVEFHTAGEQTRVRWLKAPGMAERDYFELPTNAIPQDLRRIGSEFLLIMLPIERSKAKDTDELRRMIAESFAIERLGPNQP